jgi:hypothetical protein
MKAAESGLLAKKVEALEAENARLKVEAARLTVLEAQNAKLAALEAEMRPEWRR